MSLTFLYLQQEDVIAAGGLDMGHIMGEIEDTLKLRRQNGMIFPEKIAMVYDPAIGNRINIMPCTLFSHQVAGTKLVSVFPQNPAKHGLPNVIGLLVLQDVESGAPLAVMDATLISSVRTGGIAGVAAKYLANPDSRSLGILGSGAQARSQLLALAEVLPRLAEVRVYSPTPEHRARFVEEMQPRFGFPIRACQTAQEALDSADILVTATSAQAPLLKARWVKPGSFYSHVAGWEDEYAVAQEADKIVVDDWEMTKHRGSQTLARMYRDRCLTDDRIYANLEEIIDQAKPGRVNPEERVYFSSVGLAILDAAIAAVIYHQALSLGIGTELKLWDRPIWSLASPPETPSASTR